MYVMTRTRRGCGVENVTGGGNVTPEVLRLEAMNAIDRDGKISGRKHRVDIKLGGAEVSIWAEEVRIIVDFLRSKDVESDPLREKQRKVAQALALSFDPQPAKAPSPAP